MGHRGCLGLRRARSQSQRLAPGEAMLEMVAGGSSEENMAASWGVPRHSFPLKTASILGHVGLKLKCQRSTLFWLIVGELYSETCGSRLKKKHSEVNPNLAQLQKLPK